MSQRWTVRTTVSAVSDFALLAALGFVLMRPGGVGRGYWDDWRQGQRTRHLIKLHWADLTTSPSRVDGGAGTPRADTRVIIEFGDFECPACKQAVDTVEEFSRRHPEVAIIFRHYPLRAIHPAAEMAAKAALCAEAQGRFREAYAQFYHDLDWHKTVDWREVAADLGTVDVERFARCLEDPRTAGALDSDYRLGQAIGVSGTPTFISRSGRRVGVTTVRELEALTGI